MHALTRARTYSHARIDTQMQAADVRKAVSGPVGLSVSNVLMFAMQALAFWAGDYMIDIIFIIIIIYY